MPIKWLDWLSKVIFKYFLLHPKIKIKIFELTTYTRVLIMP